MNKNKNFRKSAIVIPALALMVLTAGASATGAVAWFTANRAASFTASQFTATALNPSLNIATTAITGTTSATGSGSSGSISVDGTLTHGSFAADGQTDKNLFTALTSDSYVTGYQNVGKFNNDTAVSTWQAGTIESEKKVWYAVSWKIAFSTTLSSDSEQVAVLFNPAASHYSSTEKAHAGMKIAMFSGNELLVFGNDAWKTHVNTAGNGTAKYEKTKDTDIKSEKEYYTQNTDTTTYSLVLDPKKDNITTYYEKTYDTSSLEASFDENAYTQADLSYAPLSDKDTSLTTAKEYLGTISKSNASLSVYCVAWYEGTDSAVVNGKEISQAMTATLNFYSRTI